MFDVSGKDLYAQIVFKIVGNQITHLVYCPVDNSANGIPSYLSDVEVSGPTI